MPINRFTPRISRAVRVESDHSIWHTFLRETGQFGFGTAIKPAYSLPRSELWFTFDYAGGDHEQAAHGKATHQHASNALHRSEEAPNWWENYVAIANRRIGGRREIEASLP